ncbi:MAG: aldo/keto reductase, partial [Treponema sp.]|nr:aldo/keto reductase [Treponema sp.]
MKKLLVFVLALSCALTVCAQSGTGNTQSGGKGADKVLVVYFSCTGTTKTIAGYIAGKTGGTLYGIVPETPYTSADLNYNNSGSRANREQNNPSARPAIKGRVENMARYDVIFIGYPIWWGKAPKIIFTFLESYNLSGKTIVPFCTSGSSGKGSSDTDLHSLIPAAHWKDGRRFSAGARNDVNAWIDTLNITTG